MTETKRFCRLKVICIVMVKEIDKLAGAVEYVDCTSVDE